MIPRSPQRQSGFALILVLLSLVLLLTIAVGFFLSVTNERQSSHVDASALSVRELADSTLNVVIAQIKDGTSGSAVPTTPASTLPSSALAWASQPGLIRTFQAGTTANPTGQYQAFKLYSSPTMLVTTPSGAAFDPLTDAPPATWASSPALYTDMNAPLNRLDPNGTVTIGGQTFSAIYPIVDPGAATGTNAVKGFSISSAPTTGTTNPAPMPVQWLYELQDGTLVAGVSSGASTVTVAGASTSNPIVARVAFWTDDDSCKVNVNTAAGDLWTPDTLTKGAEVTNSPGSYWDTPRQYSNFDQTGLQNNIQARNEFQRYPGHPATTYLSAVFPWLTRAQIAAIVPRVQITGGTQGGTVPATAQITPDSDRLYSSVDELAFSQPASGATSRTVQSAITPGQIEQTRFFLTAHSRAPELNLFGGPRVAIWPIPSTAANQTTFDQTVALCSTIGGKAYYFVRNDPSSSTVDYNLGRNPNIYSYLHTQMGLAYPKFGGNFANKFGTDADQILTEIFDYIRCVNLIDSSTGAKPYADGTSGTSVTFGQGTVVPSIIGTTYGLGRFPINTQMVLNLWLSAPANSATPDHGTMVPYILLSKFCPMQGFANMYPTFDETITGLDGFQWNYSLGSAAGWNSMGFPATKTATISSSYWPNQSVRCFGGNLGMGAEFFDSAGNFLIPGTGGTSSTSYPFSGTALTLPTSLSTSGQFAVRNLKNVTITITPVGNPTVIIQKYTLTFPQTWGMKVPLDAVGGYDVFTNRKQYQNYFSGGNGSQYEADSLLSWEMGGPQISGDYRIAALLANNAAGGIPTTEFTNHLLFSKFTAPLTYSPATVYQADSLRSDQGYAPGTTGTEQGFVNGLGYSKEYGSLVPAIPYQAAYSNSNNPPFPDFPSTLSQTALGGAQLKASAAAATSTSPATTFTPSVTAPGAPGDWDNGLGDAREGAYGGKADEGATGAFPYYHYGGLTGNTTFSPNRQIASAVAFGSLPTGFARKLPWQTLLFCPNPLAGSILDPNNTAFTSYIANHPGRINLPPDYLMLDLFTMPVVEPYPISEPFSTAGKVNLNYQIIPFNYITRSTALQAVLRSTMVMALDTNSVGVFHNNFTNYTGPNYRYSINLGETLSDFDLRFTNNRPFVSATEICDMFLVPDLTTNTTETGAAPTGNSHSNPVAKWWSTGGSASVPGYYLTGSNERQKPYADIYPRLTTQSNTYTVHVRVQKIKMPTNVAVGSWDESVGVVEGEYRGSYSVERYIDPNDSRFTTGTPVNPDTANLNSLYKFRIVETKKFAP